MDVIRPSQNEAEVEMDLKFQLRQQTGTNMKHRTETEFRRLEAVEVAEAGQVVQVVELEKFPLLSEL